MGLINLVSHLPLAVRLFEPHPDPSKPGLSPELRSIVVPGKVHPDALPTVLRDVDGDVFEAWKGANSESPWLKNSQIEVVSDEDADKMGDHALSFGFEPGLEAVDATGAEDGSMEGDKSSLEVDMNAHSDVPNDDSPRSQTTVGGPVVSGTQPVDAEPVAAAAPGPAAADKPVAAPKVAP